MGNSATSRPNRGPPTKDDLIANITDGKDDLEIDFYLIDDEAQTIYLFQSKYRTTPGNITKKDLADFLEAPARLVSAAYLAKNTNAKIVELAPIFRAKLLEGYQIQLILVTSLNAPPQIVNSVQEWSDRPLTLQIGVESLEITHNAVVSDAEDLLQRFDSGATDKITTIELQLLSDEWHLSYAGGFKCIAATIKAEELARIFQTHRFSIFRDNPRGPLGAVAVNKRIKETLEDDTKRELFHLLNNGLAAVCEGLKDPAVEGDKLTVTITGLQIVNGCQTTFNVWDYWRRNRPLGDAKVNIKIVEGTLLRHSISEASNSQSQMKDWDFLFNDAIQQRIQKEFAAMQPSIFYELRRGEYKFISPNTKTDRVPIKDIAQTTWAFLGSPGEAKDRLREIPRSKEKKDGGVYHEVFFQNVDARWLALPWRVYGRVLKEYDEYLNKGNESGDYREHGRLHILWLIGRAITIKMGLGGQRGTYRHISPKVAEALTQNMDDWFPELHEIAVSTIKYRKDVEEEAASENQQTLSLRQLFRSSAKYPNFEKAHDDRLDNLRDIPALTQAL